MPLLSFHFTTFPLFHYHYFDCQRFSPPIFFAELRWLSAAAFFTGEAAVAAAAFRFRHYAFRCISFQLRQLIAFRHFRRHSRCFAIYGFSIAASTKASHAAAKEQLLEDWPLPLFAIDYADIGWLIIRRFLSAGQPPIAAIISSYAD
jgi:hypothetical protein